MIKSFKKLARGQAKSFQKHK